MDFKALAARLEWDYRSNPSLVVRLKLALRSIEDGLRELNSRGVALHLAEGPAAVVVAGRWPRMMYHYEHGHREVFGEAHLVELGPGWYDSPIDAEYAQGRAVQFRGRGGVRTLRAPTVRPDSEAHFVPNGFDKGETKRKFLAERPQLGPILSDSKVED